MHEPFTEELITARFTFRPERAEEFLADKDDKGNLVYNGRLVTEMDFETVEAIMDVIQQFDDALVDVNAIINGQVVNLVDFEEE